MSEITFIFREDGLVGWKPAGNARAGGQRYNWINGPNCPDHGYWKVVPGGWSEKKQKNYEAFYVCTENTCPNRPGREWTDAHPADDVVYEADDDPLA